MATTYTPSTRTGLRTAALARLALLMVLALVATTAWMVVRQGTEADTSASEVGPRAALAAYIGQHEGLVVEPEQVGFLLTDPLDRPWTEALDWVPAFALARQPGEGGVELEDLYYLEVRLAADGTPLALRRMTNITRTPHAREHLLVQSGASALLGVEVFKQQQSLLLVDFAGDERELPEFGTRFERFRYEVTSLQESGRADNVGMRLYRLEPPASAIEARASDKGEGFEVALRGEGGVGNKALEERYRLALDGSVAPTPAARPTRMGYQPRFYAHKQFTPWLVDSVRNLSFVGPRKIALLEKFAFHWADRLKRWAFAAGLLSEEGSLMEELAAGGQDELGGPAVALSGEGIGFSEEWPPPAVKPGVDDARPGEGQWSAIKIPWLRAIPGAPPAFVKTAVRMDPERPYQVTVLIAMDMRQLDLSMVAGTVTPESSFGTRGDGLIPREPEVIERLVAAFNGGFKTAHGAFGMGVDHRIVLPAMPFAATVVVKDDEHVQMGSWNNSMTVPDDVHSFRQNLPPLIADGKLNPTGRRKWGGTASDLDSVHTERSGMCFRGTHTLIFAWGKGLSADSLGAAMLAAGCDYGMHLDMNPTHTGWTFYRAAMEDLDDKGRFTKFEMQPGGNTMGFRAERFIQRDVKDFFYLTLRTTFGDHLPAPAAGYQPWSDEHAPKGAEGFLPLAAVSTGPGQGELVVAADLRQMTVKLQRGAWEPDPAAGPDARAGRGEALELASPAMMIDLGVVDLDRPSGFKNGPKILAPHIDGQAALVRYDDGRLALLSPTEARALKLSSVADLRGGPALVVDGKARAVDAAAGPAHALAIDGQGRLLVASSPDGPGALADVLVGIGARQAMLVASAAGTSPVRFVAVEEGKLLEIDPVSGDKSPLADDRAARTHLFLERVPEAPRVTRLQMPPVELDRDEARRQRRLLAEIKAMRQELRNVENAKYKQWIEKIRTQREAKQQK